MNREQIAACIPHAGPMCLLDEAVSWDATRIHCRSASHRSVANPLRRRGQLAAVNLVEYAAQAAALHSGLQPPEGAQAGQGGFLAGLRGVELTAGDIGQVEGALDIHATREMASALGMIYRFEVSAGGRELAAGQVTIIANNTGG